MMTSSLVESNNSSSFVILSHPPSIASAASPQQPLSPHLSSLQHVSDQMAASAIAQVLHNPKSLIEITAKRAAASLQDLTRITSDAHRNCVSMSAAANNSIGPVITTTSPNTSMDSNMNGNGYEGDRSNGNSFDMAPARKTSSASSKLTETELLSIEDVLIELRVENEKLRDVVDRNNAAMRRQLTIVQNWQKEVKSAKQAYEDLKQDSETQIQQLKQMNADLRMTIESNISKQQEEKKHLNQENTTTQTGDSLTMTTNTTNANESVQPARYTPVVNADSSNYWWDMSMELDELRGRLDKMTILEETVVDKTDQLAAHQEEVRASKELISKMEREIDQLRAEVINGSADATMISSLQSQVKIFMQSFAEEQKRSQEYSDHVNRLLGELQQLREEKMDLELKLETGCGAAAGDNCSIASHGSDSLNGNVDEPVLDTGRAAGRHHKEKHSHRSSHKHHHREKKDHHKKENKETTRETIEPPHRYIRKLIKNANVANLTSGLKLKSFKDFTSP